MRFTFSKSKDWLVYIVISIVSILYNENKVSNRIKLIVKIIEKKLIITLLIKNSSLLIYIMKPS